MRKFPVFQTAADALDFELRNITDGLVLDPVDFQPTGRRRPFD